MSQPNKPAQRTAAQKIEDLERAVMASFQTMDNMARDLMIYKDAIKLLGNKVNAIAQAAKNGELPTDEVLNRLMVENNVTELSAKVSDLVAQGRITPEDTVTESSFVVGQELENDGSVINPRLQFAVSALQEPLKSKVIGLKVGESVTPEEGKFSFRVTESYRIGNPVAETTEETQEESTESSEGSGETA